MVDDIEAEKAYDALKAVIGDLAEIAMEFAAAAPPRGASAKVNQLDSMVLVGRDIALTAEVAAMALRRAYDIGK